MAKFVRRGVILASVASGGRDCVRRIGGSVERGIDPVSELGENGRATTVEILLNTLRSFSFSRGKGIPGRGEVFPCRNGLTGGTSIVLGRRRSREGEGWIFTQLAFVPMLGEGLCPGLGVLGDDSDLRLKAGLGTSREVEGRRGEDIGTVCADLDLKNGIFFEGERGISSDTDSSDFLRLPSLFLDTDLALRPLKNLLVGRLVGTGDADDDGEAATFVTPVYALRRFIDASLFSRSLNLLPDFSKKWTLPFLGAIDESSREESSTSGLNIHSAISLFSSKAPSSAKASNTEALRDDVRRSSTCRNEASEVGDRGKGGVRKTSDTLREDIEVGLLCADDESKLRMDDAIIYVLQRTSGGSGKRRNCIVAMWEMRYSGCSSQS